MGAILDQGKNFKAADLKKLQEKPVAAESLLEQNERSHKAYTCGAIEHQISSDIRSREDKTQQSRNVVQDANHKNPQSAGWSAILDLLSRIDLSKFCFSRNLRKGADALVERQHGPAEKAIKNLERGLRQVSNLISAICRPDFAAEKTIFLAHSTDSVRNLISPNNNVIPLGSRRAKS